MTSPRPRAKSKTFRRRRHIFRFVGQLLHRCWRGRSCWRGLRRRTENVLKKRGVDTRGIEHAKGKTFRWGGQYLDNLNEAKTDFTELNVFRELSAPHTESLSGFAVSVPGHIQPELQAMVRREMKMARLTGGDTMNYWINTARKQLAETLKLVDVLLINDTEAKSLAGESNLPRAAQKVWQWVQRLWSLNMANMGRRFSSAKEHSGSAAILFVRRRCRSTK